MDLWKIDREFTEAGFHAVCGVDEAGRGPLAGPVFAAAVILPADKEIPGLNDSKKLSAAKREELFRVIVEEARAFGISYADHNEIDSINILKATFLAMKRAVGKLSVKPDIVLVDGNRDPGFEYPSICIVGGDGKSASIAAASVLAKVSRDRYMSEIAKEYPRYAFEKHKGYGTRLHYERLRLYGPSDIHRTTFLKGEGGGKWTRDNAV